MSDKAPLRLGLFYNDSNLEPNLHFRSDLLERIALQCWKDAVEYSKDKDPNVKKCVRISNEDVLRNQISALKDKRKHPVYKLLCESDVLVA